MAKKSEKYLKKSEKAVDIRVKIWYNERFDFVFVRREPHVF
jgi:hypothetical protein